MPVVVVVVVVVVLPMIKSLNFELSLIDLWIGFPQQKQRLVQKSSYL